MSQELQQTESGAFIMDDVQPPVEPIQPVEPGQPVEPIQPAEPAEPTALPKGFVKVDSTPPPAPPSWFETAKTELGVESYDELVTKLKSPAQQQTVDNPLPDDYIKNAVAYYKEHGTLKPFLDAFSQDYTKMAPEELVRHDLRKEYSDLSDAAFERLYKEQVIDRYKLDENMYSEEDVEFGKEMLRRDAEKIRPKFLEEQAKFVPPAKEDVQAKIQESVEQWTKYVRENEEVKRFNDTKSISIEVDGESYNYEVDAPSDIVEMAVDNNKFWKIFADRDGKVDMKAFIEVAAFAKNKEAYRESLIGLGRTLGTKEIKSELKNGEMPRLGVQKPGGMTGDWREQFLDAALNQKK